MQQLFVRLHSSTTLRGKKKETEKTLDMALNTKSTISVSTKKRKKKGDLLLFLF
jgi:hypothetical protein